MTPLNIYISLVDNSSSKIQLKIVEQDTNFKFKVEHLFGPMIVPGISFEVVVEESKLLELYQALHARFGSEPSQEEINFYRQPGRAALEDSKPVPAHMKRQVERLQQEDREVP